MPLYTNLEVMLRDIVGYMRSTGSRVLAADDPRRAMFGYQADDTSEIRWEISLNEVRRAPNPTILTTSHGRNDLLAEMTREARAHVITDQVELEHANTRVQRMLDRFRTPAAPESQPEPPVSEGATVFDKLLKGDME